MNWDLTAFKKSIQDYYDSYGMIAQKAPGRDGGDSCHRNSVIVVALKALGEDKESLFQYRGGLAAYRYDSKTFRRHPDTNKWYSRPENFSRDQTSMLLCAAVANDDKYTSDVIKSYLIEHKGFHQNAYPNYMIPGDAEYIAKTPDIVLPAELSAFLRASNNKWLYPLLYITDGAFFIDILFAAYNDFICKKGAGRTDQYTMLCTNLLLAKIRKPTLVTYLASKLVSLFDYKGAIQYIFDEARCEDPPLYKVIIPACEKCF